MPPDQQPSTLHELVNLEEGLVSREIFVREDLYQREMERIFARAWLFVGHESQIPRPGDYFASKMGGEAVILTRDLQGEIHVLLNTCRHRGMKVCRYDEGNTKVFTCPYHGWTFSIDGSVVDVPGGLLGVPRHLSAYHGELNRSEWGLLTAPGITNYKGSIWATWDEAAPSFQTYLGGMIHWLDALLDTRDGRSGGSEVIGGVQKWRFPANWKFAAENFAGDMYHDTSHKSVEAVGIVSMRRHASDRHGYTGAAVERENEGLISFPELGHAVRGDLSTRDRPFARFDVDEVDEYFARVWEDRQRRLGDKVRASGNGGHIFPNFSFHSGFPRTILVTHPLGPLSTEAWRWFLVDSDAPQIVKDTLRRYYLRYSGPAGMTEQDDMENWNYASEASRGVLARRLPYNYQQGLGYTRPVEGLPDAIRTDFWISEENARTLLRRWRAFLEAESWNDLPPKRQRTGADL